MIPALLELTQVIGDARLVPTEYLLIATTVLNIVNRLLTSQPVHVVAPAGPKSWIDTGGNAMDAD